MSMRGSTIMLCTLICALLAGCGSSGGGAPVAVATVVPRKTADIAAVQSRQATVVARANATSAAVQNIASTAVARLRSTAATQKRRQKDANAAATRPASPPPPPAITPPTPIVAPLPTATQPPVVAPTPTRAIHHTTKKPTQHSSTTTLASVHCCSRGEFKNAAEKRSKPFATVGTWVLRWTTKCGNVSNGQQPIMYIAIIPVGSRAPIQFIREPMPTNTNGSGFAAETLHGRYYLDVISPCHVFGAVVSGRKGARISSSAQASVVAEARAKGQSRALNAVRSRLLGHSHSQSPSKAHASAQAKARAEARARARYISGVLSVVKQVRAARKTLITGSSAINPSVQDFDPSTLQAAKDYVAAANQELAAAQSKLQKVKSLPGHGKPKTKLHNAIVHLVDAARLVRKAVADMQAGDTSTAIVDLDTAGAKMTTAEHQLKHITNDLKVLKSVS